MPSYITPRQWRYRPREEQSALHEYAKTDHVLGVRTLFMFVTVVLVAVAVPMNAQNPLGSKIAPIRTSSGNAPIDPRNYVTVDNVAGLDGYAIAAPDSSYVETSISGFYQRRGDLDYGGTVTGHRRSPNAQGLPNGSSARWTFSIDSTGAYLIYHYLDNFLNYGRGYYVHLRKFGVNGVVDSIRYDEPAHYTNHSPEGGGSWLPLMMHRIDGVGPGAASITIGADELSTSYLRVDAVRFLRSTQKADLEFGRRSLNFLPERIPEEFGEIIVGDEYVRKVRLYNLGRDTLVISDIKVYPTTNPVSSFSAKNFRAGTPIIIPPMTSGLDQRETGGFFDLQLAFSPKQEGLARDSMVIVSNDDTEPLAYESLYGDGVGVSFTMNASAGNSEAHHNAPGPPDVPMLPTYRESTNGSWQNSVTSPILNAPIGSNRFSRVDTVRATSSLPHQAFYEFQLPELFHGQSTSGRYILEYGGPIGSTNAYSNTLVKVTHSFGVPPDSVNFDSRTAGLGPPYWIQIGGPSKTFSLAPGGPITVEFRRDQQTDTAGGVGLLRTDLLRIRKVSDARLATVTTSVAYAFKDSVRLSGLVNPNGSATTAWFEWGTSSGLSTYNSTSAQSIGSGTAAVSAMATLTGLSANTTYYYRVAGQNSAGTQRGSIVNFTTSANLPTVVTNAATFVGITSATLNGSVNPNGSVTTACFEWGTDNSLSSYNVTKSQDVGSGTSALWLRESLTGLGQNTTYYYRAAAQDGGGSQKGSIVAFTTFPAALTVSLPDSVVAYGTSVTLPVKVTGFYNVGSFTLKISFDKSVLAYTGVANQPVFGSFASTDVGTANANGNVSVAWFSVSRALNIGSGTLLSLKFNCGNGTSALAFTDASLTSITDSLGNGMLATFFDGRLSSTGGIPPSPPVLLSPPSASINQPTSTTLNWNLALGATNYWLQVSTNPSFSNTVLDDSTLTTTSRQVGPLINNTTYYWRVRGKNAGGYGPYSSVWSFTTIRALPTVASLTSPSNSAALVPITPTLAWGVSTGAASYHLQVSTTSSFTTAILDDTTLTTTSKQVTGLQNNTIYYWRVRGKNDAGYGPFSTTWSFTTIVATPMSISLVSPSSSAAGISINPTLTWSAMTGVTSYHLQVSANPSFAPNLLDDTTVTGTTKQVSSLQNNATYYWRVRAKNEGGYGPYSLVWSFTTIPVYTPTLPVTTSLTFATKAKANEYTAQEYRLIGLPGSSDILAKDIVTGVQNEDWEIVWDNGASTDYLKRYDGSADFKFSVGKAFWIISKAPLTITRTVPSASLNAAQEVEIPVRSGWNLITNPFDKSIPWTRIQATNGITGAIYSFNGAFNNSTTLDPYAGYYFFNGTPSPVLTTLRVPFSSAFGKLTELEQKKEDGWRVGVEVSTSGETPALSEAASGRVEGLDVRSERIEFGVEGEAKDGLDRFDQRMPRSLEKAGTYFDRPEWDDTYSEFGKDIKAESNQLKKWEFTLEGKLLEKKVIHVTGVESIPSTEEVFLVDKDRGLVVDLRGRQEYTTEMVKGKMAFEILVGRRETVDEETKKLMPTEIKVGPNYPNPFNPETIIPIELPKAMGVKIVVYDILGRQVKVLQDGNLNAGRHWIRWNAKDNNGNPVASGIYLYRMQTSSGVRSEHKLMLIR